MQHTFHFTHVSRRQALWAKSKNIQGNRRKQIVPIYSFVKSAVRSNQPGLSKESRAGWHCIWAFSVFVCAPLSTCLWGFSHATACTVVSSANSFPAPLYLPSTEHPYTSNHSPTCSPSNQYDWTRSYLHWCSPGNPRTACWQLVHRGLNLCEAKDAYMFLLCLSTS